jgi:group I intron endonuclease|tara:strand:+ start:78 stop:653 length:576 start_codon:yes stop_codon:yes gene_type:complete
MENIMDIIYKITSPSKKVYIGRTNNFNRRMIEHKHEARIGSTFTLHKAIRKYGWENMVVDEIAKVASKESQTMEEMFILKYNSVRDGYNSTYKGCGGDMWKGRRDTVEYKEFQKAQSEASTGYKNGMHGKNHNESTKDKMKKKAAGRFSLPWYVDKYGKGEGTTKYNDRCEALSERKLKRDEYGRYIKIKS